MKYLMVLQVRFIRIDESTILIDSAFWNHLLLFNTMLKKVGFQLNVAMHQLREDDESAAAFKMSWIEVEPKKSQIHIHSIFPDKSLSDCSRIRKIASLPKVYKHISTVSSNAAVIHTGMSYDVFLPTSFLSVLVAISKKIPLVYVVDIDFRKNTKMLYQNKEWGLLSFLTNVCFNDPLKKLQLNIATRKAALALLKGLSFARDYQKPHNNVHAFYDTVHQNKDLLPSEELKNAIEARQKKDTLNLLYFGRLVKYKGVHTAIESIGILKHKGIKNITLTIIGDGDLKNEYQNLAKQYQITDQVTVKPGLKYGEQLFAEIIKYDALIALPQREDTPRSVFDGMLVGLPVIAFDTYYYKELMVSDAIIICEWNNFREFENVIERLAEDKSVLSAYAYNAATFARDNTQETWLKKRLDLTMKALSDKK